MVLLTNNTPPNVVSIALVLSYLMPLLPSVPWLLPSEPWFLPRRTVRCLVNTSPRKYISSSARIHTCASVHTKRYAPEGSCQLGPTPHTRWFCACIPCYRPSSPCC